MERLFDELEADDSIDVVVLTGAGEIAFSTGLDLKELARQGPSLIPKVILQRTGWAGIGRRQFPKPLIAAVNGFAIAGGLELVLSTDFAIAAEHAQLGFNEATLGPIADAGGCFRLPHWVPLPFAREMLMTGRLISAEEAYRVGLVNHVVPAAGLIPRALEIAASISGNSPSALKIMKRLVTETVNQPESVAWPINDRYMVSPCEVPPLAGSACQVMTEAPTLARAAPSTTFRVTADDDPGALVRILGQFSGRNSHRKSR